MADRVERLTNLLALLLETPEPLSLVQITAELDGMYPEGQVARRGAFERDKATLREIGVPIETEITAGGPYAGQTRYWIDRRRYELADLHLDDEERRALQVAVAATRAGSGPAQDGLWKLGAEMADDEPVVAAIVPASPDLAVLREAVAAREVVQFEYRGLQRDVEPYGLLLREGFWYLIGFDRTREDRRTYRVDRIEGAVTTTTETFDAPPVDLRTAVPADPLLLPTDEDPDADLEAAVVRIRGPRAVLLERELGAGRIRARHPEGSIDVEVPYRNRAAFRSWVLGLGADAVVLGPEAARRLIIDWLCAVADGGEGR